MEYPIVIKVKCGDTLRRFNSLVGENGRLDLDMEKLRAKVISLFDLALDADVTITYIDVDGDVVTLVDDDDLCDAVRQNLNPLRINVVANTGKFGRSFARSSGSSTPLRSPQVQPPLPSVNTGVADVLKSVPEPLSEAISKLSLDMASKAASSAPVLADLVESFKLSLDRASKAASSSPVLAAPVLAELVESFSRVGQSFLNPDSQIQFGADSSSQDGGLRNPSCPPVAAKPGVSKDGGSGLEVSPDYKHVEPTSKSIQVVEIGDSSGGAVTSVIRPSASVDINPVNSIPSSCSTMNVGALGVENKEIKNENKSNPSGKTIDFGAGTCSEGHTRSTHLDNLNECPFSGLPLASDSTTRSILHPPLYSLKKGRNHSDNIPIFHRGVRCDGCGVHPITGPCFKSKVKEDYDLCSICFAEMGNVADYIRMDRPASYGYPWPAKDIMQLAGLHPPHSLRGKMKSFRPRWDSRFVLDVNVMDGTVMAPSTHFTKIWRMHNSGNIAWPQGMQLVWIGGDRLNETASIAIETPPGGVPVDLELDIAVDIKAPELPGGYVSYWMMSLPSGLRFGQLVWVIIQVEASLEEPLNDALYGLNLNLPPGSDGSKGAEVVDPKIRPLVDAESVEQVVRKLPMQDQDLNFPINNTLLVGSSVSDPEPPKVPVSLSPPVVGFAEAPPVASSYEPYLVGDALERASKNNNVEETLLKELEEMGFMQVDLNKEILRMNEFNLEQSVDDLCGVSEWDPILEELDEMGFRDKEMNVKLLKKNNGSIKRVVMDLIAGEKANPKEKTQ